MPTRQLVIVTAAVALLSAGVGALVTIRLTPSSDQVARARPRSPARGPVRRAESTIPLDSEAQLVELGKELHARLIAEANVDESYLAGSLVGAVTTAPQTWIAVPMDAWNALVDDERAELMHYAASLVEPMRKNPLTYLQIPPSDPKADAVRENASQMGPRDWVIWGGPLHRVSGNGLFSILAEKMVASGADHDPGTPEEVISQLNVAGIPTDSPWRRSNYDGIWNAVMRAALGNNEVSCLLESRSPRAIESVELEAEVYRPGQQELEVFHAFAQAARVLCKEPGLLEAIEDRKDWASWKWQLKFLRYASGAGFGFVLRYNEQPGGGPQ